MIREFPDASLDPGPQELPIDVVHVWKCPLKTSAGVEDSCYKLLSADELQRARRYRVLVARSDFILTRGTLRFLVARYLGKVASDLSLTHSDCGKPLLKGPFDLRFNVSHTDGLALIAFAREREIGVDVEKVRPEPDAKKLAQRFFSMQEQRFLNLLSGDELSHAFFRSWTRKEAWIKAWGGGWSLPLHQLSISNEEGEPQPLLQSGPGPARAGRWILRDLPISSSYVASLVVELRATN